MKNQFWLNSFGGCRSNYLRKCLMRSYASDKTFYEKHCHDLKPGPADIDFYVFCYVEDVELAIYSQVKRQLDIVNYNRVSGLDGCEVDYHHWVQLIDQQIDNWTQPQEKPLYLINMDRINENRQLIYSELGIQFPDYQPTRTTELGEALHFLYGEVSPFITDAISKKLVNLPEFKKI